jgi:hypothetical protein
MEYYKQYQNMYHNATDKDKYASFIHWLRCHETNVNNAAPEMIIFSGQILKGIIEEQIAAATETIKNNGYTWEAKQ